MDARQQAQRFLKTFNLQEAKDKIIRSSQLSINSGGYELPGATWRQLTNQIEKEEKQIPLVAKNKIVEKQSLNLLKQQNLQQKIQANKEDLRAQAHKALSTNPAVKLNTNQVISDSWLPGQASAAAHSYKEDVLSYALEASRIRNMPIQKAVQEAVQNVSPSSYLGNVPLNAGETTQIATAASNPYFQRLVESDELGYSPREALEIYSKTDPKFLYGADNLRTQIKKEDFDDEWEMY
jgi:hypothetical protein